MATYQSQYTGQQIDAAVAFGMSPDATPTQNSTKGVTSGGVYAETSALKSALSGASKLLKSSHAISYVGTTKRGIDTTGAIITTQYDTNIITSEIPVGSFKGVFVTGAFNASASRLSIAFYTASDVFISGVNIASMVGSTMAYDFFVPFPDTAAYFLVSHTYSTAAGYNVPLALAYAVDVQKIDNGVGQAFSELIDTVSEIKITKTDTLYIDPTGALQTAANANNKVTDKISVFPYETLIITGSFSSNSGRKSVAFYDSDDNMIEVLNLASLVGSSEVIGYPVTVPVNSAYCRIGELYDPYSASYDTPLKVLRSNSVGKSAVPLSVWDIQTSEYALTFTSSKYIDPDGVVQDASYETNKITNQLDVEGKEYLVVTGTFTNRNDRISVAFYKTDNTFISGENIATVLGSSLARCYRVKVPSNAKYAIFGVTYHAYTAGYNVPLVVGDYEKLSKVTDVPVYVATTGNDSTGNGTEKAPYATIQKAIDSNAKKIIVTAGSYTDQQVVINNKHGLEILCNSAATEANLFTTHARRARAKLDNSIEVTDLAAYQTIKRVALTVPNTHSYHKVFIDQSLPIVYSAADYYGRADTYNAILWEITGDIRTCKKLVPILSYADCVATPGTFCYTSAHYLYIHPYDSNFTGKTFRRLAYDGTQQVGLSITNSDDIKISGLDVTYFPYNAISINGSTNVQISECDYTFTDYSSAARAVNTDATFTSCNAGCSAVDGYGIAGYGNVSLYDCSAINCGDDGVSHHDSTTGMIDGGLFEKNLKGGVTPSYGSKVTVQNVVCRNNAFGIYYIQSEDRYEGTEMLLQNSLAYDNGLDIFVDRYNVLSHGCAYETKSTSHDGTLAEFGNTVIS